MSAPGAFGRVLVALVAAGGLAACSPVEPSAGPTTRPAHKDTCPEISVTGAPADLRPSERRLVPYSDTLLGVETVMASADEERTVTVVSGTYLDDLLEAYDSLEPVDQIDVEGAEATVLEGSFLGAPVRATIWHAARLTPPCDSRAVVAVGLDRDEALALRIGDR